MKYFLLNFNCQKYCFFSGSTNKTDENFVLTFSSPVREDFPCVWFPKTRKFRTNALLLFGVRTRKLLLPGRQENLCRG